MDPSKTHAAPLSIQACQCPHLDALLPQEIDSLLILDQKRRKKRKAVDLIQQLHFLPFLDPYEEQIDNDNDDDDDDDDRDGGHSSESNTINNVSMSNKTNLNGSKSGNVNAMQQDVDGGTKKSEQIIENGADTFSRSGGSLHKQWWKNNHTFDTSLQNPHLTLCVKELKNTTRDSLKKTKIDNLTVEPIQDGVEKEKDDADDSKTKNELEATNNSSTSNSIQSSMLPLSTKNSSSSELNLSLERFEQLRKAETNVELMHQKMDQIPSSSTTISTTSTTTNNPFPEQSNSAMKDSQTAVGAQHNPLSLSADVVMSSGTTNNKNNKNTRNDTNNSEQPPPEKTSSPPAGSTTTTTTTTSNEQQQPSSSNGYKHNHATTKTTKTTSISCKKKSSKKKRQRQHNQVLDAIHISSTVNQWIDGVRKVRRNYWLQKGLQQDLQRLSMKTKTKTKTATKTALSPYPQNGYRNQFLEVPFGYPKRRMRNRENMSVGDESYSSYLPRSIRSCLQCDSSNGVKKNGSRNYGFNFFASGDEFMQCLECSMIGCAPSAVNPDSNQDILCHFLTTGHNFGITCGQRSEIFCMRCGDFIYHPVLDREKFHIDLSFHLPWLSWKEGILQRSIDLIRTTPPPMKQNHQQQQQGPNNTNTSNSNGSSYQSTQISDSKNNIISNHGNGNYHEHKNIGMKMNQLKLKATYPCDASSILMEVGRRSLLRYQIFGGHLENSIGWGTKALRFALRQKKTQVNGRHGISAPVGIYNLGNTCYLNCILQCLIHCLPLQQFFLNNVGHDHNSCQYIRERQLSETKDKFSSYYDTDNENDKMGITTNKDGKGKYYVCMACEMDRIFLESYGCSIGMNAMEAIQESSSSLISTSQHNFLHDATNSKEPSSKERNTLFPSNDMNKNLIVDEFNNSSTITNTNSNSASDSAFPLGSPIIPARFLAASWNSTGMTHLAGYEQRDAHEFLHAFLDTMGKHLRTFQDLAIRMGACKPADENHSGRTANKDSDIVKKLFEGTLRSVLVCERCGCKRTQPEPYVVISLPITKGKSKGISAQTNSTSKTSSGPSFISRRGMSNLAKITIQDCLVQFIEPEVLADPVYCAACQEKTPTQKQHTFAMLPIVLCLHLKRFDANSNKKITDPVSFPKELEMGAFLPHWCEVGQGVKHSPSDDNSSSPKLMYDLIGTVNHHGNLHQGHYVANVKVGEKWYGCNDAFVSEDDKEGLEEDGAYILFYMRRNDTSIS